jgi:hypothetical protein
MAYFEEADWPLNKALPRGAEFSCGPLGDIVRQYRLEKSQVARQLLNYKKRRYLNTQVSILLNQSNLYERIHEGMAMSTPRFVSSSLLRICDLEPSSYSSDFSNLCVVINSLPSTARTYVRLLASSPDDACFCLFVGVVENWIQDMAEKFPKTAAGVPNAQLYFKREKELKMRAFIADFTEEYNLAGLPPADVCSITFGRLGAFLHLALLMHGQMQYATTRSRSSNSRWIVLLEGMSCLSYIKLLDGRLTMHLKLLRLQWTRGRCISCLRLCIHVMRERQRR